MAQRIENRERIEAGMSQLPRTRISRVPMAILKMSDLVTKFLHTISSFIKAMFRIAMAGKDDDFMATIL